MQELIDFESDDMRVPLNAHPTGYCSDCMKPLYSYGDLNVCPLCGAQYEESTILQ